MTLGLACLVAALAVLYSGFLVEGSRRLALSRGWFDRPHETREGAPAYRPIPRVGGVGIIGAVLACMAPLAAMGHLGGSSIVLAILAPAALIACLGAVDDVRGVAPALKMVALAGAGVASVAAGLRLDSLPLLGVPLSPAGGALLTVIWLIAVPTALNFIDGLDGLAAGITIVASATLAVAGAALGDAPVVLTALAVGGSTAGFWWHNRHPARIFMGDGGAMFLGYVLGALAVRLWVGSSSTAVDAAVLLAFAVPLLDFALAMGRRLKRRAPFSSDGQHVHHRLAGRFGHRRAVNVLHGAAFLPAAFAAATVVPALGPLLAALCIACLLGASRRSHHARSPWRLQLTWGLAGLVLLVWTRPGPGALPLVSQLEPVAAIQTPAPRQFGAPPQSPLGETLLP